MNALNDPEDPPPFERSPSTGPLMAAFRTADTEPPPALVPVVVVEDGAEPDSLGTPPARASENPFDSEHRTLSALAGVRASIETNNRLLEEQAKLLAQMGHEHGSAKSFMSALALEIASQRGIKPNGLTGKRILVVDDHEHFLDVCECVLGELGCNVTAAASRDDVARLLPAVPRPFHLALVDLRLPTSEDGLDLVRWLLNCYPTMRIIVMSGQLEARGLDELPVARLEKPFTIERVKGAIYSALGLVDCESQTITPPAPLAPTFDAELPTQPSTDRETPEAKARES